MRVKLNEAIKKKARDLMPDRKAVADLDRGYSIMDYDHYHKKYSEERYEGENFYKRIIEGERTPNKGVNENFGTIE